MLYGGGGGCGVDAVIVVETGDLRHGEGLFVCYGGHGGLGWDCLGCGVETRESSEAWMIWGGRYETLALLYEVVWLLLRKLERRGI